MQIATKEKKAKIDKRLSQKKTSYRNWLIRVSCKYPVLVDDSLPPTPPPTTLAPNTWSATTSPAGSCAKLTDYPPWQREKQLKTSDISEASTFSVHNGTQLYTITIYRYLWLDIHLICHSLHTIESNWYFFVLVLGWRRVPSEGCLLPA